MSWSRKGWWMTSASAVSIWESRRGCARSLRLMRHDLRLEGVDPEVIDRACAALGEELEESALAAAALQRKRRAAGGDPERLRRLLRARGFARATVEEALAAAGIRESGGD